MQETWTYGYDQRNQLLWAKRSQTDGGAIDRQTDFKYDPYGNRIEKSYDADGAGGGAATVQRFALDGWKNLSQPLVGNENWDVYADLDGSSSLTSRYIRGDVIDQLFARQDTGTPYWYLTDHLGSIRDVIDSSAVVKDSITYDGFGNITAETDSNYRGRYAWTGREIDQEIQLQYNRARYYDAGTARWISQDPLGFDAGDSNLYRYVSNASSKLLDPSGLVPTSQADLIDFGYKRTFEKKGDDPRLKFATTIKSDDLKKDYACKLALAIDYVTGRSANMADDIKSDIKNGNLVRLRSIFEAGNVPLNKEHLNTIRDTTTAVANRSKTETINIGPTLGDTTAYMQHVTPVLQVRYTFFTELSKNLQHATIYHEFTHMFAGLKDEFSVAFKKEGQKFTEYNLESFQKDGKDIKVTTNDAVKNPDFYAAYFMQYYLGG